MGGILFRSRSMRSSGRLAIALLTLAGAITVVACSNPAQGEIDRGDELFNADKFEEAFAAYNAALELDPDNARALAGRGCSRPESELALAIADLDQAIKLDPQEPRRLCMSSRATRGRR